MNLEHVAFHNLGALEPLPGLGENGLVRIPARVRNTLNNRARFIGMDSVGIEVRFVTDAPDVDIYLSVQKPEFGDRGTVRIFRGNFQFQVLTIEPGVTHFFRLNAPPAFAQANEALLAGGGFAPQVWRIVFDRSSYVFHGVHTHGYEIRPPRAEELPVRNWLAYGSSITNSGLDGYVHVAAAQLKVQVQNKGFSGACQIEKTLVDYLIDECPWDFITCELGVNMRGQYSPEDFESRATYLIDRLVKTKKPALILSIFPNSNTEVYTKATSTVSDNEKAYNAILVRLVEQAKCPTLKLVHGYDILTDVNGLSADLIHPTTYGHAVMGLNLAVKLREFLKG